MTDFGPFCTLVIQLAGALSGHSRVLEHMVAGANHHFCCTYRTFTSSSGTQRYVLYKDWAFLTKKLLANLLKKSFLQCMSAIQIIQVKRKIHNMTGGCSRPTLLPSHLYFYKLFTLRWLFGLWNKVGCIFTVAPTFTSSSHWSQIWSRTSAVCTICAKLFGNLTFYLQHDAKTAPFWDVAPGRSFHSIVEKQTNTKASFGGEMSDLERD